MKHGLISKFIAVFLAALSLVAAVSSITGIVAIENAGLYVNGLEILQNQEYQSTAEDIASRFVNLYAVEHLGGLPYKLKLSLYPNPSDRGDAEYWRIKLQQGDRVLVDPGSTEGFQTSATMTFRPLYPIAADKTAPKPMEPSPETTTSPETAGGTEAGTEKNQRPANIPDGYLYRETETYWENGGLTSCELYYYEAPEYTVTVYMTEAILESSSIHMLTLLFPYRYACIGILVVGLIVFFASLVFLFWAAGKNDRGEVAPGGLNRMPLDLYGGIVALCAVGLSLLFSELVRWIQNEGPHPGNLSLLAVNLMGITLLAIGFCFALAAQLKVKNGYWWRHTVIGWCLVRLFRVIGLGFRGMGTLLGMMPMIWRWLLAAFVMGLSILGTFLWVLFSSSGLGRTLGILCLLGALGTCIGMVCYGAYAYGILMKGIHRMTEGDLSYQVPTKYLVGGYQDFANQLNKLSETAMISAREQTKSERMRTELITNVSHDIKTPLTSIINFVDLLQRPHTPEENAEYLEVLARQSDRMKKLIDDLMELSRASSGNITVTIDRMDAGEAVNQALGEFSDKLELAGLVPVFRQPAKPILLMADGKLLWRVLSNLLSNAIKYSLPGTRIYVDLMETEEHVLLSLKNITREQLDFSPEELTERFVRGDAARNSEGSGLGLNIARTLMELQGGQLHLLLDGDLFKATMVFSKTEGR